MVTYWHIAHESYVGGDLMSYDALAESGMAPEWQWEHAVDDAGSSAGYVSLAPSASWALRWIADIAPETSVVVVRVETDGGRCHSDLYVVEDYEGCPAVRGSIDARHCTIVSMDDLRSAASDERA